MISAQRRAALIAAAVAVLVACVGVLTVVLRQLRTPAAAQAPLNAADARQLLESMNLGLAHLENHDTERSIAIFADIAARLPAEPLGPRNLAVAHVLSFGEDLEQVTPERIAGAKAALELVHKAEGPTPQWHWLSARTAWAARDFTAASEHLAKILAADKSNASAWYELHLVRLAAEGADRSTQAREALEQAYDLQPDNLFLLVEYMRQIEEYATRREGVFGDLTARLRQARQTLTPFQIRLLAISQVDVVKLMDEAIAASEAEDLRRLADRAGQIARVTLGMAAQDRNQIRRHVLEFIAVRFRPEFYEEYGLLEADPVPAIQVSFEAIPVWQLDEKLQSTLANAQAIELADFDLDGRLDLVGLDAAGIHVLTRTTAAESWRLLITLPNAIGMTGLVVADLDLDFEEMPVDTSKVQGTRSDSAAACPSADVDIVAFGPQGLVVLRNRYSAATGVRSLERIEQPIENQTGVTAGTAADLDADGDLDLVIATESGLRIWSNRGNATFENISSRSSLPPAVVQISAVVALDWDRDVDIDVMVSGQQAGWLENLRHGQMRWHAFEGDFGTLGAARAIEPLDADANGSWDLLAAVADGLQLVRTATPQPPIVRPLDTRKVSERPAQQVRSFDYDNDGVLDLLAWDDTGIAMYRGLSDGRYQPVDLIPAVRNIRDCRSGDLDGDGDLDLVVASNEGVIIFVNEGGNQNDWLDVALVARQIKGSETSASGRVNAHGVGSLLELKAGMRYQPAVVRGQTTHFGLGRAAADVVRIVWLNGVPQNILQPPAQQTVCELQLLTGSCPYLYTWNGTRFEFVTDLLWASPLGLQAADGVLLPWREWEYLRIPGDKLVAKDGEYVLQLTEELWEAAYFDQVKLIAVDHPEGVDIYSNEKVGPPEIAQFKIHTASDKRRPVAARNHRGRDLSSELAEEDGVYAKPFDNKLRQGLVEEHFVELDLGDLDSVGNALRGVPEAPTGMATPTRPTERHRGRSLHSEAAAPSHSRRVTLFLTGWIYPSGTSLNVAISQNPDLAQPKPPVLLVPDGKGGWREALPFMGFPGGKTKTIAVDLSGLLTKGDYRLRIATNVELYWDQILFTVDEPPVELRHTELLLRGADVHFRGFSRIVHQAGHGPERFLYNELTTAPKWPPMQGRFTRLGDVVELLRQRDDRLVVLGAGDEATLRFDVPAAGPPPGWKRDFLLYSVGWDKDANLCTVLGETVEPLPFRAMRNYPPSADDPPPDTTEYRRYLRDYQTRTQSDQFWRAVRHPVKRP
ncbi:MAG: FG-GAP-like repeat-containing protein [Pirellulales bacterium]